MTLDTTAMTAKASKFKAIRMLIRMKWISNAIYNVSGLNLVAKSSLIPSKPWSCERPGICRLSISRAPISGWICCIRWITSPIAPIKGNASYWNVSVGDALAENAA
jgi:hypothetical protein